MRKKPILCLDFDGVIHSYKSGWKGASVIQDPPVDGALQFVVEALDAFDVCVFSSRSHQWGGRGAMRKWFKKNLLELAATYEQTPDWLLRHIHAFADPWPDEIDWHIGRLVKRIRFPLFKPPASVGLDDRVITFTGEFPSVKSLEGFVPWNKKDQKQ